MAKEIVLRFNAINKRRGGIGYFSPTKETLKSLPRSGLVLLFLICNLQFRFNLQIRRCYTLKGKEGFNAHLSDNS